jgi:pyruvate kinase
LYTRRTKIIATIGPATDSDAALDSLIAAGMDIARLNFSHGTHDSQAATFRRIREAARRADRDVAILQDLSGPKIRTGRLEGAMPLDLQTGDTLRIVTGDGLGCPGTVYTTFTALARGVRTGDRLLLADGLIELRVDGTDETVIQTTVVEGGLLGEHKGINAPGVALESSAVTARDIEDLRFGLSLGVDLVAVSFVRSEADLHEARKIMTGMQAGDVPIVAKLERPQVLDDLDNIMAACDAVMVARGDLGLEMPLERVPAAQKRITLSARRHKIPVIVATQVLESMTREARPTRAEVSDAANAVADGVDAIMLAGETAAGLFPSRAVQTLDTIIREVEAGPSAMSHHFAQTEDPQQDHTQAICEAAVTLAARGDAEAIVAVTRGGGTARRLSALRPRMPILATTDRGETARRLSIYWGVVPVCTDIRENVDRTGTLVGELLVARGLVRSGAALVFVSIHPDLTRADANYLIIRRV